MTRSTTTTTVHLDDYAPPPFRVPQLALDLDLISEEEARVQAVLHIERNPAAADLAAPLRLQLEDLQVEAVSIDGVRLTPEQYQLDAESLTLANVPDACTVETVSRIHPKANTKLMGVYISSTGFFSLCEAEGFRRITPFLDRPDVMARYTVTLHADRNAYPVLLANGNRVAAGDEEGGRHWATWEDPFPKPSYLFAVVAAKLDRVADSFVTRSGRRVSLQFFVEPGKQDQATFALESLKHAMTWDEQTYGLEVDLDEYNLVAVGDFNAGAMENKGLNIFNTKLVLARSDISTDLDFKFIDRTVAHEYFHNWTGNRVTCRDWFQLSLKEGLTVFREQQYAGDRYSRAVERIQAVRNLRSGQFSEDAGPMAHPVRPRSYERISNFYTATVYSKGAEVIRMLQTLLGEAAFRKGIDLYLKRHDGQAVTIDHLLQAMQDASGQSLAQFALWYDQSGTPVVRVEGRHDADASTYELTITQRCPPTPGQPTKRPFHIPLAVGLLNARGEELALRLAGDSGPRGTTTVLSLHEPSETFRFLDVPEPVIPSLGRGFSAPIVIEHDYSPEQLALLLTFDSDGFNRWEAGQRWFLQCLLTGIAEQQQGRTYSIPPALTRAFGQVLADGAAHDPGFAAETLVLPLESFVAEQLPVVDPDAIHQVRQSLRRHVARELRGELLQAYERCAVVGPYRPDAEPAGRRALRNLCLAYLMARGDEDQQVRQMCEAQLRQADNMTDALSALISLANCDCPEREPALASFYDKWQAEPLVVDKWLGVQAASSLPQTLGVVKRLLSHPAFDLRNPNKVYALLGSFGGNQARFHAADGAGYALMAEQVCALDAVNPQVAARMARSFDRWRRFDAGRQTHMRQALERLAGSSLSNETREVVTKALA